MPNNEQQAEEFASPLPRADRRYRLLMVTHDHLIQVLRGDLVFTGLPSDAEIITATNNFGLQAIQALVYHSSFDAVPPGAIPPDLHPTFQLAHRYILQRDLLEADAAVALQLMEEKARGGALVVVQWHGAPVNEQKLSRSEQET